MASQEYNPKYRVEDNPRLLLANYQFQRNFQFEVFLPDIGNARGSDVSVLVQKVSWQDYEMSDPTTMRYGAFQSFFANFLQGKTFTINFLETEGALVRTYLKSWRSLIITDDGLFKKKIGGYAKDLMLNYLDTKGSIIHTVKFKNSFPLIRAKGDHDYDTSSIMKIEVPFACDRMFVSW